jgi:EamA domain-containing membrane protein RarD
MKIIKMEKSLLVLEVGLNRTYLAGLAYLFFGLFVLAVSSLKHSDNMPVIILSIITICISFLFLLLAGKKEIEINKNSSQITINYYRNLYNKQKQVWINDVEQIMYKVRSGRGLDGRYDYYLKTKSGQSFF